jgi:phosphohistidine phosphatase
MKRLTLIRHARASWGSAALDDIDRPLNLRGEKEAPMMGRRLSRHSLKPEQIVASPATRATSTATLIAREIGLPLHDVVLHRRIYEAEMPDLLRVVQQLDNRFTHVILLGHNPGISELSAALTGLAVQSMHTCGVFAIDFEVEKWAEVEPGSGHFVFYDYPKGRGIDDD